MTMTQHSYLLYSQPVSHIIILEWGMARDVQDRGYPTTFIDGYHVACSSVNPRDESQ